MDERERLKKAVEQAERGGNYDTVHHDRLAKLTKKKKVVNTVKTETTDTDFTTKE